jgi:large-conductance mechanosensitive channel
MNGQRPAPSEAKKAGIGATGLFLNALINFLIIAFIIFMMIVKRYAMKSPW